MDLIAGQYTAPSAAEHDGFDGSRFEQGERVEIILRSPRDGGERGRLVGYTIARHTQVDVSRDGQEAFHKDLVHLKGLEHKGSEEPYESSGSEAMDEGEAFFAEEALRKREGDLLNNVSFN